MIWREGAGWDRTVQSGYLWKTGFWIVWRYLEYFYFDVDFGGGIDWLFMETYLPGLIECFVWRDLQDSISFAEWK